MSQLRARQLSPQDFRDFDVIVAMDRQNMQDINDLRPGDATAQLRMFASRDVPDPYYTRDFAGCLAMIESAADAFIADMTAQPPA
jgi:protein-tyrosine phosphatase